MRKLLVLVAVLALAGCGGSGTSQSHTPVEVAKAFSDAGLPFTALVTANPYVRGQSVFLPASLNGSALALDVQAALSASDTKTHASWGAWVFDTDAHAADALKQVPLEQWSSGKGIVREHDGNVVVIALAFSVEQKAKLESALKQLR